MATSSTLPTQLAVRKRTRSGIYLYGLSPSLDSLVREVAGLVGVSTDSLSKDQDVPAAAGLIITEPALVAKCQSGAPIVSVALAPESAEIELPRQASQLAQIFHASGGQLSHSTARPTTIIAGWQGGVGTSTVARKLARLSGALLLDASGNPPDEEVTDRDLHWGKIDPEDPPLSGQLVRPASRTGRERSVRSRLPESVTIGDPRVTAVLMAANSGVVVDAGTWKSPIEQVLFAAVSAGRQARFVLVGGGAPHDCSRLVNVLSASAPLWRPQLLLSAGRPSEQLRLIAEHWMIPLRRLPGSPGGRRWERLWDALWG